MGYFSQFVHGLSVSNMQYGKIQDIEFTYAVGFDIMYHTKQILNNIIMTK